MRIWIDLANSPHVLFFAPIIEKLRLLGHTVELTARDFAQTVGLLKLYVLESSTIGSHGGQGKGRKVTNILGRALKLRKWAKPHKFDLAVSHNSYAQIVAACLLRIPAVTLMDYEYQPANHLAFRLAKRVIVPFTFSDKDLRRYGAREKKVRRYNGLKEQVYLANFKPDPTTIERLQSLFTGSGSCDLQRHLLFLVRPAATMSAYHDFENPLFVRLLRYLKSKGEVWTILFPRTEEQRIELEGETCESIVMPEEPLDGRNAVWYADAVISAGGTMCREAAVIGTPAYTIFWGRMGSVDKHLIAKGDLGQIRSEEDFKSLPTAKIIGRNKIGTETRDEIINLCLSAVDSA